MNTADRRQFQLVGLAAVLAVLIATGVWVVGTHTGGREVAAYFANTSALFPDNQVMVLGVPVGTIEKITPEGTQVRVDMAITDPDVRLPADAKAAVVAPSLVTGRYVQLLPPWRGGPELADGAVIPLARTAVPLGVDDLTRTATELARALGPNGANRTGALSDALTVGARNLDGNGGALHHDVDGLADVTATLVDQQRALTEVIDVAPAALSNLADTYNGSSGTLDTRPDIHELANPPLVTLCKLLGTKTSTGIPAA